MTQTKPIDPTDIARAICCGIGNCQTSGSHMPCFADTKDAIDVLSILRAAGVEIVGDAP
jgi:hypothetical protein